MNSYASGDGIGTFSPASGTENGPFGTEIHPRKTVFPAGFQHARAGKPSPDGDFRSRTTDFRYGLGSVSGSGPGDEGTIRQPEERPGSNLEACGFESHLYWWSLKTRRLGIGAPRWL